MTRRSKIALLILLVAVALMGYYALRLKRRAEQFPAATVDTRPVQPPVTGASQSVTLYVADDADGLLHKQAANVALPTEPSERALQVARALLAVYQQKGSTHPMAAGADINTVFLVPPNSAVIDVNNQFVDGHRSGVLVEQLTLASLAQTLAANVPNVTRMKILVQGKERATLAGHAGLLHFYDLAAGPWPVAP